MKQRRQEDVRRRCHAAERSVRMNGPISSKLSNYKLVGEAVPISTAPTRERRRTGGVEVCEYLTARDGAKGCRTVQTDILLSLCRSFTEFKIASI